MTTPASSATPIPNPTLASGRARLMSEGSVPPIAGESTGNPGRPSPTFQVPAPAPSRPTRHRRNPVRGFVTRPRRRARRASNFEHASSWYGRCTGLLSGRAVDVASEVEVGGVRSSAARLRRRLHVRRRSARGLPARNGGGPDAAAGGGAISGVAGREGGPTTGTGSGGTRARATPPARAPSDRSHSPGPCADVFSNDS